MAGYSLHLGVDSPDPSHYGDRVNPLTGAEADARAWHAFAAGRGYAARLLVGAEATTQALRQWIGGLAARPDAEHVLLTWAGHGTQIDAAQPDREPGGLDETWVLWDRMLLDDEMPGLLGLLPASCQVVVVADSCHSHGSFRDPGGFDSDTRVRSFCPDPANEVYRSHADLYAAVRAGVDPWVDPTARVVGLAACTEAEKALESGGRGHFSVAALELLGSGFTGSYDALMREVADRLPGQHPMSFWYGYRDTAVQAPAFPPVGGAPA